MEDAGRKRFQILALSGGGYRGLFTAKVLADLEQEIGGPIACLLYTSPSPRDPKTSRMPSSA